MTHGITHFRLIYIIDHMLIQTTWHSWMFLFILYFLRISSKLKNLIKIAQTKARTITWKFVYRVEYIFHLSLINDVCEYSPLRNTMSFYIEINNNLSSMKFNYLIRILNRLYSAPRESNGQFLSKMVTYICYFCYLIVAKW